MLFILLLVALGAPPAEEVTVEADPWQTPASGEVVVPMGAVWASDDLVDALGRLPGVQARRLGGLGDWASVSLRGASSRQTQVFLDGIPLNPDGADAVNLAELPPGLLEQARVWRFGAPAAYGASAMGGVIDLGTTDAEGLSLRASGGSFGTGRAQVAASGKGVLAVVDGFGTRGAFPYLDDGGTRFDASDDAVRLRQNNQTEQVSAILRARGGDRLRWTTLASLLQRGEGLPGPIGAPTRTARLDTTRSLAALRLAAGGVDLEGNGALWHTARVERFRDPDAELGLGSADQRDTTHQVGGQGVVSGERGPWRLTGQAQGRVEGFQRLRLVSGDRDDPAWRQVTGLSAEAVWRSEVVALTGAVDGRLIWDGEAIGAANPRLHARFTPSPLVAFRVGGGRAFRPPDLFELRGDRGISVGNPNLRPESAWTAEAEVGVRHASGVIGADVGVYARQARDLIVWIQNSQRTMVPVNVGRARVVGAEATLRGAFPPFLHADLHAAWTDARNATDDPATQGRFLPTTPAWTLSPEVRVTPVAQVRIGWRVDAMGRLFLDAVGRTPIPARAIHGLRLEVQPWRDGPSLALDVRNVGDVTTGLVDRDPLRPGVGERVAQPIADFAGYPLPGRVVLLTLLWEVGRG